MHLVPGQFSTGFEGAKSMIDWGYALYIAGGGFGTVFILLAVLAVIVWATSRLIVYFTREKSNP